LPALLAVLSAYAALLARPEACPQVAGQASRAHLGVLVRLAVAVVVDAVADFSPWLQARKACGLPFLAANGSDGASPQQTCLAAEFVNSPVRAVDDAVTVVVDPVADLWRRLRAPPGLAAISVRRSSAVAIQIVAALLLLGYTSPLARTPSAPRAGPDPQLASADVEAAGQGVAFGASGILDGDAPTLEIADLAADAVGVLSTRDDRRIG